MKTRNMLSRFSIAIALMALTANSVWQIRRAHAMPTAVEDQATFGMVGIASAQRTTININKMQFARDPAGQRGLTMFEPKDHTIYCIVGISNPSAEVKYKFVWSYYDRTSNQRKDLFTQDLDNQTANEVISKFSSPHDLAAGSYTVEIYIDGRMRQQRKFYV